MNVQLSNLEALIDEAKSSITDGLYLRIMTSIQSIYESVNRQSYIEEPPFQTEQLVFPDEDEVQTEQMVFPDEDEVEQLDLPDEDEVERLDLPDEDEQVLCNHTYNQPLFCTENLEALFKCRNHISIVWISQIIEVIRYHSGIEVIDKPQKVMLTTAIRTISPVGTLGDIGGIENRIQVAKMLLELCENTTNEYRPICFIGLYEYLFRNCDIINKEGFGRSMLKSIHELKTHHQFVEQFFNEFQISLSTIDDIEQELIRHFGTESSSDNLFDMLCT